MFLRCEELTPETYSENSRDFQLLCRLNDFAINGTKLSIDLIPTINDTKNINTSLIPLLQTKLGFFTSKNIDNDKIRYYLMAFRDIIRYKGSIKAIKMSMATFLKAAQVKSEYSVQYFESGGEVRPGIIINAHTIAIGLETSLTDVNLLTELLSYVVPAGSSVTIYYFTNVYEETKFLVKNQSDILFTSNKINSMLRAASDSYTGLEDRLLNAVDTVQIRKKSEIDGQEPEDGPKEPTDSNHISNYDDSGQI